MATDQDALLLQMSADIRGLEKQMAKARQVVDSTATQAERRLKAVNDNAKGFNPIRAGAQQASGALDNLAGGFSRLGPAGIAAGVAVAGFTVALNKAADAAQFFDDLSAAANKIGVTAEALQELRHAAEANDIPVDKLDEGLRNLNGALGAIKTGVGDGKVAKALAAIDIDRAQLANLKTADELLPLLADKISGLGSQAEQVQIARKLGIEELLPLLQQGSAGVAQFREEARRLGLVMDESTVQQSAEFNEQLRIANERSAAASRRLATEFIPVLVSIKNAAADAAGALAGMFSWLNRHDINAPDFQIQQRLKTSQKAREDAAKIRSGGGAAFLTGRVSGLEAMSPAARERVARRLEGDAARIEREIESISDAQQAKAKAAAEKAAAAAKVSAGGDSSSSGGGSGRRAARASTSQKTTELELQQLRTISDLRDNIEIARAAGNDANAQAMQDELDRLQRIADLRKQGLDDATATAQASEFIDNRRIAREVAANRDRLANLGGSDFVSTEDRMAQFAQDFAKVGDGAGRLTEEFDNLLDNGIGRLVDGLSAAAVGAADLGDVFRQTIQQMAIDANRLILQSLLGTGESSGGGFLKGLFKFGASALGGSLGGLKGAAGAKLEGGIFIPAHAAGTNNAPGGLSLVGERGPELINIPRHAQVIPNDILRTMARSRVGNVNNSRSLTWQGNVVIQAAPGMSAAEARRTGAQAAAGAMRELAVAKRRGY